MGNRYGIIVSVEEYLSKDNFPNVKYANADAELIKTVFMKSLEMPEENILMYKNEEFSSGQYEGEMQYFIKTLEPDADLFFYYAGHGFFLDGENYLTLYDTSILDLVNTSVNFETLFLSMFKKSSAKRCIAFIDACAQPQGLNARGINMRGIDLSSIKSEIAECKYGYTIYMSCSPNEKSYSSNKLGHGIWTWFLAQALMGNKYACDREPYVTAYSLKNYLHKALIEYKNKTDEIPEAQTPYAIVSSSEDEILLIFSDVYDEELECMKRREEFSFKEECFAARDLLFNSCSLVCYEKGILVDDEFEINDFDGAKEVCKKITAMGFCIDTEWKEYISMLRYYCEAFERHHEVNISYEQQVAIICAIYSLIDDIPDGF